MKAIVFDCFGVLTTDTWRAFLDSLPDQSKYPEAHSLNQAYGSGIISREVFFEQVEKLTGQKPVLTEDRLDSEITKNLSLLEYIRELRKREYKIGLLSNIANNWIRDSFLTDEEQSLFDAFVLSYEVGRVKPDPEMFRMACRNLSVEPSQAVMVDDVERYCQAAESIGMKSIVYDNFQQFKQQLEEIL